MTIDRRTFAIFTTSAALSTPSSGAPPTLSLPTELQHSVSKNQPLVVMVGFASCPYCKVVRQNYMPVIRDEFKLTIAEIDMHTDTPVVDFFGNRTTHRKIARDWNIKVSPTLLFFGKDGREIAKRLVGVSQDFYSAYLEDRIREAQASFKK